jgi:putative endonuclease
MVVYAPFWLIRVAVGTGKSGKSAAKVFKLSVIVAVAGPISVSAYWAFYTGVTNDLKRRLDEHYASKGKKEAFAGKYFCYQLIFYERFTSIISAIEREKEIKDLSRNKKLELIKEFNPSMSFIKITT